MDDEEVEHVSVGVEIMCDPAVKDDIVAELRDAVAAILDGYGDEVSDYGVG